MANNFFKSNFRKIITAVLTLALILNLSALAVSASSGKSNGKNTGGYKVNVHLSESVASNKEEVTIILNDGTTHTGNMQGAKLVFAFPTTDNGFSIPAGGLTVRFVTESGVSGSMTIFNQEGNAQENIEDEHDKGANNYRANVTVDVTTEEETTEEETEEVTTEEETEEETTEDVPTVPSVPSYTPSYTPDNTPDIPVNVVEIEDVDVPRDSAPEVEEVEEIEEIEEVEEVEDIEDEDVPLSDVPQTGSASVFFLIMTVASAIGLIGVNASKQDKKVK